MKHVMSKSSMYLIIILTETYMYADTLNNGNINDRSYFQTSKIPPGKYCLQFFYTNSISTADSSYFNLDVKAIEEGTASYVPLWTMGDSDKHQAWVLHKTVFHTDSNFWVC